MTRFGFLFLVCFLILVTPASAWTELTNYQATGLSTGFAAGYGINVVNISSFASVTRFTVSGQGYSDSLSYSNTNVVFSSLANGGGTIYGNGSMTATFSKINNYSADYSIEFKITDFNAHGQTGIKTIYYRPTSSSWTAFYRVDTTKTMSNFTSSQYAVALEMTDFRVPNGTYTVYSGSNQVYASFTTNASSCAPSPVTAQFNDTSTGSGINSWAWDFGDGYTSIEQNPAHSYLNIGNYTVNLTVSNGDTTDTESAHNLICVSGVSPLYHLNIDVIDSHAAYVNDSIVGIYDGSVWYNASCSNGACGFVHTGSNGQNNILLGSNYTISAAKTDYQTAYKDITFSYDYQTETLVLANTTDSNQTHLDLDVLNAFTGAYVNNVQVSLYRNSTDTWDNKTSLTGSTGWLDYPYGETYLIEASRGTYSTASKVIQFTHNHQVETLYLVPQQTDGLHMNVDIVSSADSSYVPYADYGIYDYSINQWQNGTCVNGACGFVTTGINHNTQLHLDTRYQLYAGRANFTSLYQDVYFAYDNQVFTLRLTPVSDFLQPQALITISPQNLGFLFVPVKTNLTVTDMSSNWSENYFTNFSAIPTLNATWDATQYFNITDLTTGVNPLFIPWFNAVNSLQIKVVSFLSVFLGFVFGVIFFIPNIVISLVTQLTSYLNSFSVVLNLLMLVIAKP